VPVGRIGNRHPHLGNQISPFGNLDFPIWEPRKQLKVSRLSVGLAIAIPIWEPRLPHLRTQFSTLGSQPTGPECEHTEPNWEQRDQLGTQITPFGNRENNLKSHACHSDWQSPSPFGNPDFPIWEPNVPHLGTEKTTSSLAPVGWIGNHHPHLETHLSPFGNPLVPAG
jgi:hypothetical protein